MGKDDLQYLFDVLVGEDVVVPDTLLIEEGDVIKWLYTYVSGSGVQKYEGQWSDSVVMKYFQPVTVDASTVFDIAAVFVTVTPQLSVHYLSPLQLESFLGTAKPPGLLQKFTPRSTHHQLTQVIWTPYMVVCERRMNTNPLRQMVLSVPDRVITDKSHVSTREVPIQGSTQKVLENICRLLCTASMRRFDFVLTRLNLYFLSCKPPVFMFCSSLSGFENPVRSPPPRPLPSPPPSESPSHHHLPRDDPPSGCTTPAPTPNDSDTDSIDFDVEIADFEAVGGGLLVYTTRVDEQRPDGYLVIPSGSAIDGTTMVTVKDTFTEAQRSQANAVNKAMSSVRSPSRYRGVGTLREPNSVKISKYAAGEKVLSRDVPRNGVHALRRKYNPAAQTALLQGGNAPMEVPLAVADVIPKVSRKHVLKDKSVVGAAAPATLRTRPASAPASKLLSALQNIDQQDKANDPLPACYKDISCSPPTVAQMSREAKRVEQRRHQADREKEKYNIPSLEVPEVGRAASAGVRHAPSKPSSRLKAEADYNEALALKEMNWDSSTHAERLHLPRQAAQRVWRPAGRAAAPSLSVAATTPSRSSVGSSLPPASPSSTREVVSHRRERVKAVPRYPIHNPGEYHQSLSEMMRKKGRKGKGKGMLEALFGEEEVGGGGGGVDEGGGEEEGVLDVEKKALEERAAKLEVIRAKRQKAHEARESAKLRSQYTTLETQHFNTAALDYLEDELYSIYSHSLQHRAPPPATHELSLSPELPYAPVLKALLTSMGFTSQDCGTYTIPYDKVLLSNTMASLSEYRESIRKIFRQQNTEVMKRLKDLIAPDDQVCVVGGTKKLGPVAHFLHLLFKGGKVGFRRHTL